VYDAGACLGHALLQLDGRRQPEVAELHQDAVFAPPKMDGKALQRLPSVQKLFELLELLRRPRDSDSRPRFCCQHKVSVGEAADAGCPPRVSRFFDVREGI